MSHAHFGASEPTRHGSRLWVLFLAAGACLWASTATADFPPGDTNCNGQVNTQDLTAVVEAIFNGSNCSRADVNADQRLTAADLPEELMLLIGSITPTGTRTPTVTKTGAPTQTSSATGTFRTATATATQKLTPTGSPTDTGTATVPITATATLTNTPTLAFTATATPTVTPTATSTATLPGPTSTGTLTPTVTQIPSVTPTSTPIRPFTATPTVTATQSATLTPTPTSSAAGPVVLFFGIATTDGCVYCDQPQCECLGPTPTPDIENGRQVFTMVGTNFPGGFTGAVALTVIEGHRGTSNQPIGTTLLPANAADRPDVWVESTQPLGSNPTTLVECRNPGGPSGGVPAVPTPDFGPSQAITDALTDFACRLQMFTPGQPCTYIDASGDAKLVNPNAEVQFCTLAQDSLAIAFPAATTPTPFPVGDSLLTTQLRDTQGNLGPTAQIVVRVITPTP